MEENKMRIVSKNLLIVAAVTFLAAGSLTRAAQVMDFGWRFAFGHATGTFSYFAI
ncbi:MAG: hypothetical protein WAK60_03175 [Sedimentisphaerales bacterium]